MATIQVLEQPAIIEHDLATAEREIAEVWREYQVTEKYGLKLGKKCCEWRDRFGLSKGGYGSKGKGLSGILTVLKIPRHIVDYWIQRYEESVSNREPSEKNEWYTPAKYIEAARKVMGGIDLDPASCDKAQETVQALGYYTKEINGLQQKWTGRVWLNPPYSNGEIWPFIKKLLEELEVGNVEQSILLTMNWADTGWFHEAEKLASLLCFTKGRIEFDTKLGSGEGVSTDGQTFFYFGENKHEFSIWFKQFGFIR